MASGMAGARWVRQHHHCPYLLALLSFHSRHLQASSPLIRQPLTLETPRTGKLLLSMVPTKIQVFTCLHRLSLCAHS